MLCRDWGFAAEGSTPGFWGRLRPCRVWKGHCLTFSEAAAVGVAKTAAERSMTETTAWHASKQAASVRRRIQEDDLLQL